MKDNKNKGRRKNSKQDNLPTKVKKFSIIALLTAGIGTFGYKLRDIPDSIKRNKIIKEMTEGEVGKENSGAIRTAKAIYATAINKENGETDGFITSDNIHFDLSNYMNKDGEHYALELTTDGNGTYFILKEVASRDYNTYVLTVDVENGESSFFERTAEYKEGLSSGRYLNVYSEGSVVDNYSENIINKYGELINAAIAHDQPNELLTGIIGEVKFKKALKEYFKNVPTEYLGIIAQSIREKGVIDPSLYVLIDPSLHWNKDIDISPEDVEQSLESVGSVESVGRPRWKDELVVQKNEYVPRPENNDAKRIEEEEK